MIKPKQNEPIEKSCGCNCNDHCSENDHDKNKTDNDSCNGSCNSNCCGCDCENDQDVKSDENTNQHETNNDNNKENKFKLNLDNLSAEELKQIINELNLELEQKEKSQFMLQNKLNDVILAAKQIMADFDNFRKRTENEKQKEIQLATRLLIMKLLPVIDQFSLCLQHAANKEEFVKTVPLMYAQIMNIMDDSGLKPINALNQKFDPKIHEAIMLVPSQGEENIIVEEVQKGYFLYGTVIRMSKVKVSKNIKNMEE